MNPACTILSSCIVENEVSPDEIELTESGTHNAIVFTLALKRLL